MKKEETKTANDKQNSWLDFEQKEAWTAFLRTHPELKANFSQSYNWGLFHQALGQSVFYRVLRQQQQIVGAYIAVLEQAKFYKFLSISGGPLLDWSKPEVVQSFLADARFLAKKTGAVFVRFKPAVADAKSIRQTLQNLGCRPSPAPFFVELAGVLDLRQSDEQLRQNMSQSLRRKIRKAEADKEIEITNSQSREVAEEFAKIHQQHAQAMAYVPFSQRRLILQFTTFAADNQAILYVAKRKGQILAANMIFFFGDEASYHFGVSTPLGRKHPSAPLLHLAAIAEARRRQMTTYNLWGITKKDEVGHRYWGLSQFKRSFGVLEHQYVPAHDLACRRFLYFFIALFEAYRRRRRRL